MKTIENVLFLLLLVFSLVACQPEEPVKPANMDALPDFSTHPKNEFYTHELEQFRQLNKAPGAIMLVKTAQDGVWIGGSGKSNLEYQTPMTGAERIRVGSITKTFTSTIILQLVEQGVLQLEDNLAYWLPQTKGKIPQADKISIKQLLTHTSGIRNLGSDNIPFQLALINRPIDTDLTQPEKILEKFIYNKPLRFEPGADYNYSNTGYILLGMIAEQAAQKPLKNLMQDRIFTPLQMTNTYLEKRADPSVVRSYMDLYGDGKLLDVSEWEKVYEDGSAAGGIITTVLDLLKFSEALFGGRLLKQQTVQEMQLSVKLPSCPEGDCEYGYGLETWKVARTIGYGHNGGVIGLDATWLYFPDKQMTIISFLNLGTPVKKDYLDRIIP
ncbi:serine hydrolase domain-containing protein [Rhodocytophaga aerolata]|uniref:Serine hydrolase domain-containing protein n=1 Tax=Rhodocytophaga aerolata TaxID=455078 RepID=A0ABT8RBQ0_9BACT|nr:serine hydrolase domain-containing protein [Rhodocytophaga aerolata]MDO1448135.1 serine hydrolase domain-containing protein [Rhodocytophaga aerolata]